MREFDHWLLALHERFAHWFQRKTGFTNFTLARGCLLASPPVVMVTGMMLLPSIGLLEPTTGVYFIVGAVMFLILWPEAHVCKKLDEHYSGGNQSAHALTQRLRDGMWPARMLLVGIIVIATLSYVASQFGAAMSEWFLTHPLLLVAFGIMLMGEYFMACIPLPPAQESIAEAVPQTA